MSAKWFRRILNNRKPKNISYGSEKNGYFLIPASPQQIWRKNWSKRLLNVALNSVKCSLYWSNIKLVLCLKFQTSRMSGTRSKTHLSMIPRLDIWVIVGSWRTFIRYLMSWWCHVSNFRSLGCLEPNQRHPYPPSLGWIFGWQMVPDACFVYIFCPGVGVMPILAL